MFNQSIERLLGWYEKKLQNVSGSILSGDKTYIVVKYVLTTAGARAYDSLYTIMNEYNQVMSLKFCYSGSEDEVEDMLQSLRSRLTLQGIGPIDLFYTDNCCCEYSTLVKAFPELQDDRKKMKSIENITVELAEISEPLNTNRPYNLLTMPNEPVLIINYHDLSSWIQKVRTIITTHTYVGFDIEWDSTFGTDRRVREFSFIVCYKQRMDIGLEIMGARTF